jgi:nucleoside-diphosphate-sugar epimerase
MRVLIVGCGYVGMALGVKLLQQGDQVFGLRRAASPDLKVAGLVPLIGDITKPEDLARLPSNYDWVVNCVSSSKGGVEDYRTAYLQGTLNLIEWLSARPPKKFVYTSSTSVYGQTDGSIVTEISPAEPSSETARVLVETENILLQAAVANFPAVILRVAGIYGPNRGYWLKQFLRGEATIEGNGERFLNMVHRDDVVGAIITALENGKPGQIYNVTDDESVTQLALFQWLATTLGKPMPPFVEPGEQTERKRGLTNKRVSNSKLKTGLGYQLKYPTIREGYIETSDTGS